MIIKPTTRLSLQVIIDKLNQLNVSHTVKNNCIQIADQFVTKYITGYVYGVLRVDLKREADLLTKPKRVRLTKQSKKFIKLVT